MVPCYTQIVSYRKNMDLFHNKELSLFHNCAPKSIKPQTFHTNFRISTVTLGTLNLA